MKPLRILAPELDLLAEIDDYESLAFTRRWHGVGEFSFSINRFKQNTDTLQKGNLIMLGNQINKVGIIKHREIGMDVNGKQNENWLIKGYTLEGVVNQRITLPPVGLAADEVNLPAESVMKHYINQNIINPIDISRKIDQMVMANDQGKGQQIKWSSRYKNLAEELEAISLASGLGWFVTLDLQQKKWVFDVLEGRNLTTSQSEYPPVIFSTEFETLKSANYIDSDFAYKNFAYTGGQGEGVTREIQTITVLSYEPTGLDRNEVFIDARDLDETESLTVRGQQKLTEYDTKESFEAEVFLNGSFQYERDFDLGDVVTVHHKGWGVMMETRIVEITETIEPSGIKLEATFGAAPVTLISKLKQEFSQIKNEIVR